MKLAKPTKNAVMVFVILAVIAYFVVKRWLHLDALGGDQLRTFWEAYRISQGETIYRDFTCQYPPLPTWLLGGAMAVFGATFLTAQWFYLVVGLAVTATFALLIRQLVPPPGRFVALFLVVLMFSIESNVMALFTLSNYTVSIPVGLLFFNGYLLMLLRFLHTSLSALHMAMFSLCATGALLSKPEFGLGVIGALIPLLFYARTSRPDQTTTRTIAFAEVGALAVFAIAPALVAYGIIGVVVGYRELFAGITGYYVAQRVVPILPTGYGLVSAVCEIARGAVAVGLPLTVGMLVGKRFRGAGLCALCSVVGFIVVIGLNQYALQPEQSNMEVIRASLDTIGFSGVVTWASYGILFYLLFLWAMRRPIPMGLPIQILVVVVCLFQARALFQTHLVRVPDISYAGCAYIQIMGVIGIYRAIRLFSNNADTLQSNRVIAGANAAFLGLVCLITVIELRRFAKVVDGRPVQWVSTRAGRVAVAENDGTVDTYRYIEARVAPGEYVADLTYGSVCFPAHLKSPMFSTQMRLLCPKPWMQERDLQGVQAHPPRLVVLPLPTKDAIFSGTNRYVLRSSLLVWKPNRLFRDDTEFPVVEWLQARYTQAQYFPRYDENGILFHTVDVGSMPRVICTPR